MQQVKNANMDMESHRKGVSDEVAGLTTGIKRAGDMSNYHFNQITKFNKDLQEARKGRDRASKFGNKVPDLLARINRERHQFQGPVIGPIGARVAIREGCEKWAKALECALFSMLKSFVVTTVASASTWAKSGLIARLIVEVGVSVYFAVNPRSPSRHSPTACSSRHCAP